MRELPKSAALASIAVLTYLPVAYGLGQAFTDEEGHVTLKFLMEALNSRAVIHALTFTLTQALISSALSVALGFLGGLALLTLEIRGAGALRALSIIPFLTPSMVVVEGFTTVYGPNGLITKLIPQASALGSGFWGVIAAHVFYNTPLAMNLVYASLVSVPKELIEAVNTFSSGRVVKVLSKVVVPFSKEALASSFTLIFIYCFISFAIPLNIGGVKYSTLEVYIYYYYKLMFNPHIAAAIAFLQFAVLSVITALLTLGRFGKAALPETSAIHTKINIPFKAKALLKGYLVLLYVYLFVPLVGVGYAALVNPYTGSLGLGGFLKVMRLNYDPVIGTSLSRVYLNTAYYAFISTAASLALGTAVSLIGGRISEAVFTSLLAVSPLTLSLGLVKAYGNYLPNPALIVMAHTVSSLPLTVRVLRLGALRVGKEFLEAAKIFRAKGYSLYARVIYPLMKPSYLVAASLAVVISLGEFTATLFIAGPESVTLSVAIYFYRGVREFQAAGAASAILLVSASAFLLTVSKKVERWL